MVVEVHLMLVWCSAGRQCTSLSENTVAANRSIIVLCYKPSEGLLALPFCLIIFDWSCKHVRSTRAGFLTMYDPYADLLSHQLDSSFCWRGLPSKILTHWLSLTNIHLHQISWEIKSFSTFLFFFLFFLKKNSSQELERIFFIKKSL